MAKTKKSNEVFDFTIKMSSLKKFRDFRGYLNNPGDSEPFTKKPGISCSSHLEILLRFTDDSQKNYFHEKLYERRLLKFKTISFWQFRNILRCFLASSSFERNPLTLLRLVYLFDWRHVRSQLFLTHHHRPIVQNLESHQPSISYPPIVIVPRRHRTDGVDVTSS